MRYNLPALLLVIILTVACNKKDTEADTPDTPIEEDQEITVLALEKETNVPVAGATVYLNRCSDYDIEFGCQAYKTIKTLTTNDSGKAIFQSSLKVDQVKVQHPKYWPAIGVNPVILTPIATIKAVIKKVNTYPATTNLSIAAYPADCAYGCAVVYQKISLPLDTIVFFKGFGYSDNQISWYTTAYQKPDSMYDTAPFHINGFDTAQVTIDY